MSCESPESLLECIRRRMEILSEIREGTDDKRDLVETLTVSRSTVNRAFNDLTELGIIRERAGDCELTLYGENAYRSYRRFIEMYDRLVEAKPLLVHLPSSFPFDYDVLRTATVHLCERPDPRKPIAVLRNRVEAAHEVRVLSSVAMPVHAELYYSQIVERDLTIEFILSRSTHDYLHAEYPEKFRTALQAENTVFREIEDELTFGLVLIDGAEVWFGVYDDRGRIVGALADDTPEAVEWAESLYEEHRESSTTVSLSS